MHYERVGYIRSHKYLLLTAGLSEANRELAATAGLVKVAIEVKKYFDKTAEELEAIQQAKVAGIDQIASLRTITKSISLSFIKLNTDVFDLLSQEDKKSIEEIMKGMMKEIEKCEGTVSKLKAHTRKKIHTKSELEVLRGQLNQALSTIHCLQVALTGLVSHQLNEDNTQTDAFDFGNPEL